MASKWLWKRYILDLRVTKGYEGTFWQIQSTSQSQSLSFLGEWEKGETKDVIVRWSLKCFLSNVLPNALNVKFIHWDYCHLAKYSPRSPHQFGGRKEPLDSSCGPIFNTQHRWPNEETHTSVPDISRAFQKPLTPSRLHLIFCGDTWLHSEPTSNRVHSEHTVYFSPPQELTASPSA